MKNMNLLLLPGNSQGNKSWIKDLENEFSSHFEETNVIEYKSWDNNDFGQVIDFPTELIRIQKTVSNWDNYCVFAKSVGTALCMKAIQDHIIHPKKCVFVGLPLTWLKENKIPIDAFAQSYILPTLFIQQKDDPFANSEVVGAFIKKLNLSQTEYLIVDGNDHRYSDIQLVLQNSLEFLLSEK